MALTSVGAIYATQSLLLQRTYIPHTDDSEINRQPIFAGETLLLVPLATYQQGGVSAVQALIGTPSITGNCVIVDPVSKLVVDRMIADVAIYNGGSGTMPDGHLVVASDAAMVGDLWNGTIFTRAYLELDHTTGLVVATSTQNILTAAPTLNALNRLINASAAPGAIIGSSVYLTARIVAGVV
jgi:hypothetical protein